MVGAVSFFCFSIRLFFFFFPLFFFPPLFFFFFWDIFLIYIFTVGLADKIFEAAKNVLDEISGFPEEGNISDVKDILQAYSIRYALISSFMCLSKRKQYAANRPLW